MIILKTSSEVKVTVTHNWYMTYHHPKMLSHTKCVIPSSKNIGDMHQTQCQFFKLGQRWRSQWPRNGTLHFSSQDACTHQIWGLSLKWYERYASDTIIKKNRSVVKVTVTWKWYVTHRHPKMQRHTKFGIPISNNTGDMLQTRLF